MSNQTSMTPEEIGRIGEEIYQTKLRAALEPGNIGKFLSLDILSEDFEISTNRLDNAHKIRERHPDAIIYTVRVGYDAVVSMGGQLRRTDSITAEERGRHMSNQTSMSLEEIVRIGEEIYQTKLRAAVEPGNIGKLLSLDIFSGDYEINTDRLQNWDRLRERHPDAEIYTVRIGYNAVDTIGGRLQRTGTTS
jgi:hypothetical protein